MGWLPSRRTNTPVIERRDPTAATKSISFYSPSYPMEMKWDAERAFKIAYLGNAIVFRCVQIIANDIAALPLRVGPNPDKPQTYRANHILAKKLSRPPGGPNPKFSSHTIIKHAIASLIVAGRFGWEYEPTVDGFNLWPLVTTNLKPIPTTGGNEYFQRFDYDIAGPDTPKKLTPEQVHYQWFPSHDDIRQPESVIQAANLDISVAIMQDRYDYAFLTNDARPAAVIVHERFSDPAAQEEFRSQFLMDHQGVENRGKIAWAAFERNGEFEASKQFHIEQLSLTHQEGQFNERYNTKIRNICAALGVPLSKLDASGRTFDNAAAEEKTYWQDTIRPLADFITSNFSIDLLQRIPSSNGLACWFDYSAIEALRNKVVPVSQPVGIDVLWKNRLVTKNEARADYGLPSVPDGEEYYDAESDPNNPIAALIGGISPNGSGSSEGSESDEGSGNEDDARTIRKLILRKLILGSDYNGQTRNGQVDTDSDITPEEIAEVRKLRVIRETETAIQTLETKVKHNFVKLFGKQETVVIQRLESRRGKMFLEPAQYNVEVRQIVGNVFDYDYWRRITTELAHSLHEDIFTLGGMRVAQKLGISFDIKTEYIQQFVFERANNLAGKVTNTTYQSVQNELADGSNRGETIQQLTDRVKLIFKYAAETRALLIARTEVNSAYNGAAQLIAANESHASV